MGGEEWRRGKKGEARVHPPRGTRAEAARRYARKYAEYFPEDMSDLYNSTSVITFKKRDTIYRSNPARERKEEKEAYPVRTISRIVYFATCRLTFIKYIYICAGNTRGERRESIKREKGREEEEERGGAGDDGTYI